MKQAKFFSVLVFMIAALYGITGYYFLPLANYQGDLTRMGMLPESLFGWTKAQPVIDPALMQQSSWQDAEVLVIGDSFSEPRIWQTVLTGHGLRVHSEHWENIREICDDFSPWLHAQGFRGKYVVIEALERDAPGHFAESISCKKTNFHQLVDEDKPREPPAAAFDLAKKYISGRLSVGIKTFAHTLRYEQLSIQPDFKSWSSDGVIKVARIPQGCDLFSHSRCQDALFLGTDSDQDLGEDVISNIKTLNTRFDGLTPIWAIVPNKSTAYLYPDKRFWDQLEHSLVSANLLKSVRLAIRDKTIDVYPANNGHFSTAGYLLMGEEIFQKMNYHNASTQ